MAKAKKRTGSKAGDRPGEQWFSREECSRIFGVSLVQFDRHHAKLAPKDAVSKTGHRSWFHVRKLIDIWLAREVEKAKPAKLSEEVLLSGDGNSEWLDALRKESALLKRMDRQEREGTHLNARDLHDGLMRFANTLRKAGEVLQRRWGNDAADLYNDALDAAVAQLDKTRGSSGPQQEQ